MAGKMKAFVMRRIGEVALIEKPVPPDPGPNDAVIRSTAALICTSDVHTVDGGIGERVDRTLGHESVGIVHKVGREVTAFREGDRVAVGAVTPDFRCDNCQRGFTSQCTTMLGGFKFVNLRDGTLAEYFFVNDADANLARIPDPVSDEAAAYTCDMMSTGLMGAENADIPVGGMVAVFAQGPVGLMATVGARLRGAALVIGVESVPNRQELSRRYGADEIVDFTKRDPVEAVMELTGGLGVDSSIEAFGGQVTFEAAVRSTRPGGTVSVVGYFSEGDYVKIPRLAWGNGMGDQVIRTGLCPGGRVRLRRLLRLIETGRVDPTWMTTHRFSFDDVERAFTMMRTKEEGMIKALIEF